MKIALRNKTTMGSVPATPPPILCTEDLSVLPQSNLKHAAPSPRPLSQLPSLGWNTPNNDLHGKKPSVDFELRCYRPSPCRTLAKLARSRKTPERSAPSWKGVLQKPPSRMALKNFRFRAALSKSLNSYSAAADNHHSLFLRRFFFDEELP